MTEPDPPVVDRLAEILRELDVTFEQVASNAFAVQLPGERRLRTACVLTVGEHAVGIEAFVLRKPEENRERLYAALLRRNARAYVVSWSIDDNGDIYLTGKLPLAAISADEIDRVLGSVLDNADGSFNGLVQLGFGSAIVREWDWRVRNGESLANLQAFADFARRPRD